MNDLAKLIDQHRRAYDSDCGEDYGCSCNPKPGDHYTYEQRMEGVADREYAEHLASVVTEHVKERTTTV